MTDDPHAFIYLDPPYAIKDNLYGHGRYAQRV